MIVLCLLTSDFPSENPHSQTRTFYTLNVVLNLKPNYDNTENLTNFDYTSYFNIKF
jgi:hypothetical protein